MAEAHPVGFRWVMKAQERGAKVIHVDPRFGRTSAMADQHVADPRRARDIAFLGGLIRHVHRDASRYFKDYVLHYTNAATLVDEDFQDTEDLGGVFCGFDPETGTYDRTIVDVRGRRGRRRRPAMREHADAGVRGAAPAPGMIDRRGQARRDAPAPALRLPDPQAATSRATRRRWSSASAASRRRTSCSVADALIANSGRERTTALVLRRRLDAAHRRRADDPRRRDPPAAARQHRPARAAASWRCAATRRSRARPTSRRSTTCCPATCTCRAPREEELDARGLHRRRAAPTSGWWSHFDKYIVSLLKAWFGDAATPENDFGFGAPAEDHRQPLALPDDAARARRRRSTGCS